MARTLGEVVAIEKATRQRANTETGALHKLAQKPVVFAGLARTYTPFADDGIQLPPEGNTVQERAEDLLAKFQRALTPALDLAAAKDFSNTRAVADVVVGTVTLLQEVPVSHLLFLEHQLHDILTFVEAQPVLDPAEHWTRNDVTGLWDAEPAQTVREEKSEVPLVLFPATKEHPAQVKTTQALSQVGTWKIVKSSGALPAERKRELLARIAALQDAVKTARERANQELVTPVSVGAELFGYLFA